MHSHAGRFRRRVAAFAGAVAIVLAACAPVAVPDEQSTSPVTVSPVPPGSPGTSRSPSPLDTAPPTSDTATISGEFEIENTTPGGDQVHLDTLAVHLETSPTGEATWARLSATCDAVPAAPVTFDARLVVRYACVPGADGIPPDGRLRAVVEATIAGSNEVFRLASELEH